MTEQHLSGTGLTKTNDRKTRRLSKAQREWLEWVGSCGAGVTDITDRRTADPLLHLGYASYDQTFDAWFITEAGRAALEQST